MNAVPADRAVPPMRTLHSPRLRLEPQCVRHAEAMFAVLCDPAIYTFENEPPASLAWLQQRFERLESRQSGDGSEWWLNWVLRRQDPGDAADGPLVGFVQASLHLGDDDGQPQAWVAYVLASAHWHQGLATEAVATMLDELAGPYGATRALAVYKQRNLRSERLLQRLGFAPIPPDARPAGLDLDDDEAVLARALPCLPPSPPATAVAD